MGNNTKDTNLTETGETTDPLSTFTDQARNQNVLSRRRVARDMEIYLSGSPEISEGNRQKLFDLLCQLCADMDRGVRELAGHAMIRGKFIDSLQYGLLTAYTDPRVEQIAGKLDWDLSGIVFKLAFNRLASPDEREQLNGIITLRKIAKFDRNYSLAANVLKNLILNSTNPNMIIAAMETLVLLSDEHGVEEDSRHVTNLLKEIRSRDSFVLKGMLCHAPGFFARAMGGELSPKERKACKKRLCSILNYTFEISDEVFMENLDALLRQRHPLLVGRNLDDEAVARIQAASARLLRDRAKNHAQPKSSKSSRSAS